MEEQKLKYDPSAANVWLHVATFDEAVSKAKGVKDVFVIVARKVHPENTNESSEMMILGATFSQEYAERYTRSKPWGDKYEYCYKRVPIMEADGYDYKDTKEMEEHYKCRFSKDLNQSSKE